MRRRKLIQALASIALLPSLAWTRSPRWVEIRVEGKYYSMTMEVSEDVADQMRAFLVIHLETCEERVFEAMRASVVETMLTGRSVISGFTWGE